MKRKEEFSDKECARAFEGVFYFVEATNCEVQHFWSEHAKQSRRHLHNCPSSPVDWQLRNPGYQFEIGRVGSRPICVAIRYVTIADRLVMFYEVVSQLADHAMTERWLMHFTGGKLHDKHCNADNFHNCLHAIERANEEAKSAH